MTTFSKFQRPSLPLAIMAMALLLSTPTLLAGGKTDKHKSSKDAPSTTEEEPESNSDPDPDSDTSERKESHRDLDFTVKTVHAPLAAHKSDCSEQKRPGKDCENTSSPATFQQRFDWMYGQGFLSPVDIDPAELTEALKQRFQTDKKCTLKEVDLAGLKQRFFVKHRKQSGLKDLLTTLQGCETLTYLNLEGLTLKDEDYEAIAGITSLDYLNLKGTNLTVAHFKKHITKLRKLRTLLVAETPARNGSEGLQYPHDFDLLPKLNFFDGQFKGGFGTKARLAAMGTAFLSGHAPFKTKSPAQMSKKTFQKVLRNVGKQILEALDQHKGVEEAGTVLSEFEKQHDSKTSQSKDEPKAEDYYKVGKLFNEYPDASRYFFRKAKSLAEQEYYEAKGKSSATADNTKYRTYQGQYYHSQFLYGRDLYRYSETFRDPEETRKKAINLFVKEAKEKGDLEAAAWLENRPEKKRHEDQPSVDLVFHKVQETTPELKDVGSFIKYIKEKYITDYGCTLQSLDLMGLKVTRFSLREKAKLTDLLSLVRRECKGLQALKIADLHLTDEAFAQISGMDQLRNLTISNSPLSSKKLKMISQMNRLKSLRLDYVDQGNHISKSDLQRYIFPMRDLVELSLNGAFKPERIKYDVFTKGGFAHVSNIPAQHAHTSMYKRNAPAENNSK